MTKQHRCLHCCGPDPKKGPTREALAVQVENLRGELASARTEREALRHFLRSGDARMSFELWCLWRADAWRHRHRAEAFAAQLTALGATPNEPTIPPLPAPRDEDDRAVGRWFAQAATTDEAKGTAA